MWRIVVIHDASGREVYKKEHETEEEYRKDFERLCKRFEKHRFEKIHESDHTVTYRKHSDTLMYHILGIEYITVPKK